MAQSPSHGPQMAPNIQSHWWSETNGFLLYPFLLAVLSKHWHLFRISYWKVLASFIAKYFKFLVYIHWYVAAYKEIISDEQLIILLSLLIIEASEVSLCQGDHSHFYRLSSRNFEVKEHKTLPENNAIICQPRGLIPLTYHIVSRIRKVENTSVAPWVSFSFTVKFNLH